MRIVVPNVPFLCQYDNVVDPASTCNVTSVAMALMHYGKTVTGPYMRVPDNLSNICLEEGLNRGELGVIASLLRRFGVADDASFTDNFADIKAHLKTGNIVICQGLFTPSGHVIVVRGVDEEKGVWICNDPAGHWPDYTGDSSGEAVGYPSEWFRSAEGPDGQCWAHLLSSK